MLKNIIENLPKINMKLPQDVKINLDNILYNLCRDKTENYRKNNPFFLLEESKDDIYELAELSNAERKYLHLRCEQLNLLHESYDDKENRRIFKIIIEKNWNIK